LIGQGELCIPFQRLKDQVLIDLIWQTILPGLTQRHYHIFSGLHVAPGAVGKGAAPASHGRTEDTTTKVSPLPASSAVLGLCCTSGDMVATRSGEVVRCR
jgi:hypothetical protein